ITVRAIAAALQGARLKVLCGCISFGKGPDKDNTEGLRSALARLRNRTGPSIPQPQPTPPASPLPSNTHSGSDSGRYTSNAPQLPPTSPLTGPRPQQQQQHPHPHSHTKPAAEAEGGAGVRRRESAADGNHINGLTHYPERYVPGSPIFRDSSAPPNATPSTPITAAPTGAAAAAATTTSTASASPTSRSRGQAMTISLSHAAQGNATATKSTTNNSSNNNNKPKPLATCYMSTRSAAMMALTLGQQSSEKKSSKPASGKQTTSSSSSNASPRTNNRAVSMTRPANRSTPTPAAMSNVNAANSTCTATATSTTTSRATSKPSTPTAVRAAAQLNGMGILSGGSNSSGSDNDGFSTSGSSTATALRRLYFKSGRSIKNKINSSTSSTPLNNLPMNAVSNAFHNSVSGATAMHAMGVSGVPKLVVMGTSSASIPDTTINTSTDSACTLITNVTHTDTSETCDSLDLGDNSGPSEPLFSSLEEPLLTAIQIDSEHEAGGTELELTSCSRYPPRPDMNLQDSTESQESCLSILTGEPSSTTPLLVSSRQPSTAPPPTRGREHFTFDPPQSPKSARSSEKARSHFTFKEETQQARRASSSHYTGSATTAEADEVHEERLAANRNKKLRARERDTMNANGGGGGGSAGSTRNRISPNVSPSSSNRTSPKRERKRTTPSASTGAIAKINSAPPTMKDGNFFGSCQNQKQRQSQQQQQQQLSPSSSASAQQRKYSSSSSSGSSERCLRDAAAGGTMFPFDREALDYERIQRECFAPSSATASTSSDSEEGENCSVYERKLSADIFQQYSRLTQQEQQQQQHQLNHERDRDWDRERERPPSRKNSKRIRPDSVIHTTIRENQQYVPQSDAFYPQTKSSSSPSDHSYAELNKFEDIASKFEQIPPKHGSNSTLNLQMLHMHSPGSESLASASLSPTDTTRKRSFKSKSKSKTQTQLQAQALEDLLPGSGSSAGAINVTANPLEAAAVCKQPRATIVVQQRATQHPSNNP
ncbi:uncharacterized protein Dvir_GJ22340, partial [Drosophila virilis]